MPRFVLSTILGRYSEKLRIRVGRDQDDHDLERTQFFVRVPSFW